MDGITLLEKRYGMAPADVAGFVHGTTVGINTVIQRKGARLALLTTAGFEDVIELARLRLPEMYSLYCAHPDPLIPRDCVFGVAERILADGSEQLALDEAGVREAIARARAKRVDGIVIAFLHAYRDPTHEAPGEGARAARGARALRLLLDRDLAGHPRVRAHARR